MHTSLKHGRWHKCVPPISILQHSALPPQELQGLLKVLPLLVAFFRPDKKIERKERERKRERGGEKMSQFCDSGQRQSVCN